MGELARVEARDVFRRLAPAIAWEIDRLEEREAKMPLQGELPGQQPRGNLLDRMAELEHRVGLLTQGLEDLMKNTAGIREAIGISQPSEGPVPGSIMPEGQRVYYPGEEGPRPR